MKSSLRSMTPSLLLTAFLFLLAITGCSDDATEPPVEAFSLEVEVTRPDDSPVEGLKLVVWNVSASLQETLQDRLPKRRAETVVRFALPERSLCWLTTYDLDGRVLQAVVESDTLPAGIHMVGLGRHLEYHHGVQVMRYELVVRDLESGDEQLRESKYMTAVHLDPDRVTGGRTDANGRYLSADRTMVPGLYGLAEMAAVDETGERYGTFTLNDTLRIRAYDELGRSMGITHVARDERNRVKMVWDPAILRSAQSDPTLPSRADEADAMRAVPVPDVQYELGQNYPNPFN